MRNNALVRSLAAIAHVHRLGIVTVLAKSSPSGLPAGEIAHLVGIQPANASFHLKELDRAGLVSSTRDGRIIRYRLARQAISTLLTQLARDYHRTVSASHATLPPVRRFRRQDSKIRAR
jgi:ArsR family transcriptional regulator